jgi:uncharacterized protein YjhX (UPF0386 family)
MARRKSRKRDYHEKYSKWLASMRWTWFATFTTPYELTLKSARRLVERTVHQWQKLDPTVRVFWVAERFELKDGYHLHALVYARNGDKYFGEFLQVYQAMARGRVVGNKNGKPIRAVDRKHKHEVTGDQYDDGDYEHVGEVRPRWCRIELRKFDPKRAAADYLVPYMFKEQSRGQGADYDWCIPCNRRDQTPPDK